MNQMERILINYVCKGDLVQAKKIAKSILEGIKTQTDEKFKTYNLKLLEESEAVKLPYNLQSLLIAEDVSDYPINRLLLRDKEKELVERIIKSYKVATRLNEMGIRYVPSLLLYGKSGCGKTELSKYIAHKMQLPFIYVKFSNLVESLLGKTQNNLASIFEFVRNTPCVLCFDEIDAIGVERGDHNDVSEMSRVVISLMQEMDRLPNNVIVIGTTNRFDRIDKALARRFTLSYEIKQMTSEEAAQVSRLLFESTNIDMKDWFDEWNKQTFSQDMPASEVVTKCTEKIVDIISESIEQ